MLLQKALANISSIVAKNKLATLLILVASFLRFYRLAEFVTFLGDQGRDAIIIKRIVTLEHLPAIGPPTSIGQVFLGPFFYYFMSPFLFLSNFNPIGLALGTALLSVVGLALAYAIVKKEIGQREALIFLFFLTFLYVHVDASRYSWNPNLLSPFAFLTLYFFYKALTDTRVLYGALFGAFLSFSIQLHYLAGLMIPLFAIVACHYLVKKRAVHIYKKFMAAGGAFMFFSFPLVIFDLRHNFLNLKNLVKLANKHEVASNSSLFSRVGETTSGFATTLWQIPTSSYGLLLFALFLALYVAVWKSRKLSLLIHLMFLNTLTYLIFFSFIQSPRIPHYFGSVYFSFFASIGYLLARLPKKLYSNMVIVALLGIFLFLNVSQMRFLWESPGYQIVRAQKIATSIRSLTTAKKYQIVSLPYGETDAHVRYFLELEGQRPLPEDTHEPADELFVLCFKEPCLIMGNPQWQIAAFAGDKVAATLTRDGVNIYKVVHDR